MPTETLSIRIDETGSSRVARGFGNVDRSLSRVGRTGHRVGGVLQRQFSRLPGMVSRFSSALGGLGVALGGRAILKFDDALGQLQADAGMTTKEARKLRNEFLAIGEAHGVAKEELVSGAQEWQDYTGVLKKMLPQMERVAKIHKATGTPMKQLATISAALMQSLGLSPEGAVTAMAKLNEQSRAGAVNMKKAAGVLPELLAAGSGYGFKGTRGATQMGLLLQTAGAATGGKAEEARTQALGIMRDLVKNAEKLKKMGVHVFDPNNPKEMRDIDKVMSEIVQKTGGVIAGKRGMGSIFTEESIKGAMGFTKAAAVRGQLAAGKRGGMATVEEQLRLKLTGIAAESEKVKKALASLDASFQEAGKKVVAWAAQNPWAAGGAALGGIAALKGGGGILRWLLSRGKGGKGGLAGAAGAMPVYVVNMPGGGGLPGAGGGAAGKASRFGKFGKALGLVGAAAGAGVIANAVGAASAEEKLMLTSKARSAKSGQAGIGLNLTEQAAQLVALSKRGATSVDTHGGRKALTPETMLAVLQASAQRQGASDETWQAIVPLLRAMLEQLKKPPVVVGSPGIDAPRVEAGRGK